MFGDNELKVTVNQLELLTKLKENRAKHEKEYAAAKEGFRKLLIEELEEKLADAKAGERVELSFENTKPVSHLKDYDDVIGMLEFSTEVEITINHQQYRQYVLNEWDWTRQWQTSNVAYLSAALGK